MGDDLQFWKSVWPDVDGAVVDGVEVAEDTTWTGVHAGQWAVTCPACGMAASRVHSTYGRRLADRPIGGRRVILRLMVRRFLGDNAACKRRTVAEQVEHLTTPYQHEFLVSDGQELRRHFTCEQPGYVGEGMSRREPGHLPTKGTDSSHASARCLSCRP
ncbi:transposase family protein [Streptomyces sp. NPDC002215]|uniref:transposase family protein n=1 Tax=Streptomyces sp. NPDC002215 TaxID=3154412 RepID=UPI00331E79F3